jgi:hypothetical protein
VQHEEGDGRRLQQEEHAVPVRTEIKKRTLSHLPQFFPIIAGFSQRK